MATYAPGLPFLWFEVHDEEVGMCDSRRQTILVVCVWGGCFNVLTMVLLIILYLECSLYVKSLLTFQRPFQVLFIERSLPYLTRTTQIYCLS